MTPPISDSPRVVLRLDRISRRRAGRAAVQDLSLELQAGQVMGLLGVNGAGKSTTLSMIAGALRPDSGGIELNGEDFLEQPELARTQIGWLPERAPVWAELSVEEHLDAHGRLRGLNGAALRQARSAIIERLELQPLARRLAGVLSQGQRQRLGLACALLHRPPLLVLDEPANALDPVQVAALRTLIREQAAAGTSVILSTHLLPEVTAVCDRVAILHEGTLRHDGPVLADDHAALEKTFFGIAMNGGTAPARAA
ncbi:ABC transporter [Rhodanobacter thiooxydans]|uniref:ABC transporter n=1 Tax=Rhodanobacter thiooxydans TaxID=416169 RepID=A0A154QLJ3_9GAMM|nr:ABC transporter ATP-binding protein [Rhodanobacter thiooxydans]EIL97224.1 multidrug ABC transporter ATPase [Rhodanobacter thiooxydans LCS2]KZC24648.1 ABC transporter [Rhodanobacter thiooxydans]MCW0202769.1 ABC transporter ATP-binding protein [Rhodanobacter thiooxydans]